MTRRFIPISSLLMLGLAACSAVDARTIPIAKPGTGVPSLAVAIDSVIPATIEASGLAAPIQQSTVSTRLMGAVTAVLVHEGDRVRAGQVLVRLDTRELDAKAEQSDAALLAARAQVTDAERHALRIRALFADSAAPRAMLDAAETSLIRAQAGLAQAEGAQREISAVARYSELRSPFDGVVTRRFVDPGAFATPGAPLVTIEEQTRLRVSVTTTPVIARRLRRGDMVDVRIEDVPAVATVEGVVPVPGGGEYMVNALVANPGEHLASGGAATLFLHVGNRRVVLVPMRAITREGDLTGVRIWRGDRAELRWVRLGEHHGEQVEVLSGLVTGERIVDVREPAGI